MHDLSPLPRFQRPPEPGPPNRTFAKPSRPPVFFWFRSILKLRGLLRQPTSIRLRRGRRHHRGCFPVRRAPNRTVCYREGFRTPLGVRKSPRNEPAGRQRSVWGFRSLAGLGASATGGEFALDSCDKGVWPSSRHRMAVRDPRRSGRFCPSFESGGRRPSSTAARLRFCDRSCRAGSRRTPSG